MRPWADPGKREKAGAGYSTEKRYQSARHGAPGPQKETLRVGPALRVCLVVVSLVLLFSASGMTTCTIGQIADSLLAMLALDPDWLVFVAAIAGVGRQ